MFGLMRAVKIKKQPEQHFNILSRMLQGILTVPMIVLIFNEFV